MKKKYLFIILILSFAFSGFAFVAEASSHNLPPEKYQLPKTGIPTEGKEVLSLIELVASWVFAIFVAVSIIFIVMGAFEFVTAQGDPAKITKARQSLIYAVIGIAIALMAFAIPRVVRNVIIGSSATQTQQQSPIRISGGCASQTNVEECRATRGTCDGNDCVYNR
ncbi:MAG: hypothetical protein HYW96_00120 [Candidatus Wildermuthbacteria bacterium]|nr:hypothetical protein [Candidatus Wildermuthbacteria bacterium]